MASEWRQACVEQVAERVAMGPFGSSIKVDTFVVEGVPIISGQHLNGMRLDETVGYNFITPEHADRLKNANVQRGDVIFTHRGNIGQVAYIPANSKYERYVISQSQFYLRPDPSRVLPEFIVAYFKTPEGQHKLLANTSQVGVPSIAQPVTYLRTIELPLPPLPEQRAIAHILGTLDDKIELNRRMSETLEAMARALFKAWFVDFEPVRAKMNLPSPSGRGAGGEGGGEGRSTGKKPPLPTVVLERARELRKRTTDAERLLWQLLRNRQIVGAKFRRQHPIPPYILDFYCHEHRLAVEIDGGQHNQPLGIKRDRRRTEFLEQQGIRVLRFWNHEVLSETEAVLQVIYDAIVGSVPHAEPHHCPHPNPLPEGEGIVSEEEFRWPQHILDLFPDRLVDSELGEIPAGWEVGCVSDGFDLTMGQSPPGDTYNEAGEGMPFYQGRADFGYRFPTRRVYCTAPTRIAKAGDTLISVRAPVGDINMASEDCAIGRGVAAARHKTGSRSYTYHFMYSLKEVFARFEAEGTVFGSIGKKDFHAIPCVLPPRDLILSFERRVSPLDSHIEVNERESRTLAALRDALLPKLISGELRVKDAERFLEERGL